MPRTIETKGEILAAVNGLDLLADVPEKTREGWLDGFVHPKLGKRSGPLVHLLEYVEHERVLEENEWGGNNLLILVEGALDVYMTDSETGVSSKVNEVRKGESFGEMSLFAGVPRVASVVASSASQSPEHKSLVLKIARSAFKALEAPQFIERLGQIYESRGVSTAVEQIRQATDTFTREQLDRLQHISNFKVFGRSHVLCEQGEEITKLMLIRSGWVRRSLDSPGVGDATTGWAKFGGEGFDFDFLGGGNCLGLETLSTSASSAWHYNTTVMLRTEVMEIDLASLRADAELCAAVQTAFLRLSLVPAETGRASSEATVESLEEVITTGIVEAENVLVMDMDLCIRCGNCSFACEKVHGQSRLVRRGIHIQRTPPGTHSVQHLLVPEVCVHCQDPECLTACPTSAISRRNDGQIDVEAKTCTGCLACAQLCPYNAISMIPEIAVPRTEPGFAPRFKGWLGLASPSLPPAAVKTETANLVAAKCNLCADTSLNPPGASKPAYSCEENCPTGALVRINPLEYFDEVKRRLGFVFQSPTMALGRNIHRRDPLRRLCHLIGVLLILVTLGTGWWAWMGHGFDGRLGALHLTLRWLSGLVGVAGIAGSMAYSARRRIYKHRAGPLRYWMLAHVYLGSVATVAIFLHGVSHAGGPLTTTLMVLFDLVLLTGLFGMTAYYVTPRLLTSIEGDPVLLEDLETRRRELRGELERIRKENEELQRLLNPPRLRFESSQYLFRQIWRHEELSELLAAARVACRDAAANLREKDREAFMGYVETMATLRRVDALIYLHRLMKVWLPPHIIAASLMLALLFVHIVQVTFFALR